MPLRNEVMLRFLWIHIHEGGLQPRDEGEGTILTRTIFRVWIAASVCWIGAWSWYYHIPSCAPLHEGEVTNLGWHCDSPTAFDGQYYLYPLPVMLAVIVGIPLAILAAGISLCWVALALRREGEK